MLECCSYLSYIRYFIYPTYLDICQTIPQKIVLGGGTDREPTIAIKYPAWNSTHETLGNKQPLKISAVI